MTDPRICYVVNNASETSVPLTLATSINEHHDVTIELLTWFSTNEMASPAVPIEYLHAPRNRLGLTKEIYTACRNHLQTYDLVQAHHPHSGSFAKVIANRVCVPSISREGNVRRGFTRKGRIANGLTNPLSEFVVCNSQAVYDSFTRWERALLDDDAIRIIPNGVDFDRIDMAKQLEWSIREEASIAPDSILVGSAAVFSEQKALDVLIKAIGHANTRSSQQFDLVLAGDGPLRPDLEHLSENLEIGDRVHFLGLLERDQVYKMMEEIDIYAMPSRWEGFANAAVEALGVGNACLFSDIDAFVGPYQSVAAFHRVDDAEHLADQLVELGSDPERRDEYIELGRSLVKEQYTLDTVAESYMSLYEEVLTSSH